MNKFLRIFCNYPLYIITNINITNAEVYLLIVYYRFFLRFNIFFGSMILGVYKLTFVKFFFLFSSFD